LNVGDIIFFEYDLKTYKDNPIVLTFGKTFYYPWAYSRELTKRWFPDDIGYLENEFIDDELSILRDMFGYTLSKDDEGLLSKDIINDMDKNAKSGKVHFNYALYQSGGELRRNKHLPRPGSPKASSYEFYLQQNGQTPLTTYGDPARKDYTREVRLSGRKFYMKSENADNNFRNNSDDYSIILDEVLMGKPDNTASKFKFTVNFENLTKKQLELLIFALNLNGNKEGFNEDTLYHQIGYGKNYGMGAVKIQVDDGFVVKLNNNILSKEVYDKKNNSFGDIKLEKLEIKDKNFKEILKMHRTEFHYPSGGKTKDTKGWHSDIRKLDLQKRRGGKTVSNGNPRIARTCSANSLCDCVIMVTIPVSRGRGLTSLK
jgi:CRISPR-associated protein (TIGR03986 family)